MRRLPLVLLLFALPSTAFAQAPGPPAPPDGVSLLLRQIEGAIERNAPAVFRELLTPASAAADTSNAFVADWIVNGVTRAAVQERLRLPSPGVEPGFDVYVDALVEFGRAGRVGTWLLTVRPPPPPATGAWRIESLTVLTTVSGLYRLDLNTEKEFTVHDFTLRAEDFEARVPHGSAFVSETESGITALVLLGKGAIVFSPAPDAEKGQVKIFSGQPVLKTDFDWLYIRLNPADFQAHVPGAVLTPRAMDQRDFRKAAELFQENLGRTYGLDLDGLSRDTWSVMPKLGDLVAEIGARRAQLTYMRSTADPEDIRFFDRTHERTIPIYASRERLASRGRFFDEDEQTEYDILHYDIDASFDPAREWIDGKARLLLVAKKAPVSTLILTLAEPLVIRSVVSRRYGYLMPLRVRGQSDVVINLPEPLPPNVGLDLEFEYGGRLPAPPPEREAVQLGIESDFFTIPPEPSYIYTGRTNWYPQGSFTDYATANLVLKVPENFSSVATGAPDEGWPALVNEGSRTWKEYRYSATQPVRYLAWAISKFVHVTSETIKAPRTDGGDRPLLVGVSYSSLDLSVESSGMLRPRAVDLAETTADVMKFYAGLLGDFPYQTFTLAVVERNAPGGHSPPYFASLSQPPPATPIAWRSDPAYFSAFPEFFIAHEAAHQWWGQAIGWKNYHEQWLSEGFAQYFAALYAEQLSRRDTFGKVIAQMTRWAVDRSDQGPVYLGYRLGHLKNDSRVFRAVIYNKGAIVLHMLRRLIGDDAFFRGVRRFYATWRFRKAGTEDLKAAFEAECDRPLDRFFERWIYEASLPHIRFTHTLDGDSVVVRFEQVGDVFDVPITVTIDYDGSTPSTEVVVPVTEQVVEERVPMRGRSVR